MENISKIFLFIPLIIIVFLSGYSASMNSRIYDRLSGDSPKLQQDLQQEQAINKGLIAENDTLAAQVEAARQLLDKACLKEHFMGVCWENNGWTCYRGDRGESVDAEDALGLSAIHYR